MLRSAPLLSSSRNASFCFLGAIVLFSACVPVLGIDEPELASDTPCRKFVCNDEACAYQATALGASCGAMKVCDGAGECKVDNGFPCADGAECTSGICNGTCKSPTNGTCSKDDDCASAFCFFNECKLDVGGTCTQSIECASDLCLDSTCKYTDGSGCDRSFECASNACVGGICRTSDGSDCTSSVECASGGCSNGKCLLSDKKPCSSAGECASNICNGTECITLSCDALSFNCGPDVNESCCTSIAIPGGPYDRSNNFAAPATIDNFRLDRFEVTVGRFRKFLQDYPNSRPVAGAGEHPAISGSGWNPAWDTFLPATQNELTASITMCGSLSTWSPNPGEGDPVAMNCVDWYLAFAFCAWDGGRLPTEAEWNYAAAGGKEQRDYPWWNADEPTSMTINATYAIYNCEGNGNVDDCISKDIGFAGSRSPFGDGLWSHADLAGNLMEWTLDWYAPNYTTPCLNCANLTPTLNRVLRGGSWFNQSEYISTDFRTYSTPGLQDGLDIEADEVGFRCARPIL